MPPVPARSTAARSTAARSPHRASGRTSLAAARAAFPLPYPEPAYLAPVPPPGAVTTPRDTAAPRPRPASLPPLPPSAAVPAIRTGPGDLLGLARHGLAEAAAATSPAERYAAAHLGALRAAAAVIAACARPALPPGRRTRPLSAWVLLASLAPELGEWAAFFASGARKRAAAEARMPGAVTLRDADDLLRDAETFLAIVETKLGGAARPSLLDRGVG